MGEAKQKALAGTAIKSALVKPVDRWHADMAKAAAFRMELANTEAVFGLDEAMVQVLSTMIGLYSYLAGRFSIDVASKTMSGALQDMHGQALIKRAQDIKAGRRPQFKADDPSASS